MEGTPTKTFYRTGEVVTATVIDVPIPDAFTNSGRKMHPVAKIGGSSGMTIFIQTEGDFEIGQTLRLRLVRVIQRDTKSYAFGEVVNE